MNRRELLIGAGATLVASTVPAKTVVSPHIDEVLDTFMKRYRIHFHDLRGIEPTFVVSNRLLGWVSG